MANETKKLQMEYPYEKGNPNFDGKFHTITAYQLNSFQVGNDTFYLMNYIDNSLGNQKMYTILSIDSDGNFRKRPLDDYNIVDKVTIVRIMQTPKININVLSDTIKLGKNLKSTKVNEANKMQYDIIQKFKVYTTFNGFEVDEETYHAVYNYVKPPRPKMNSNGRYILSSTQIEEIQKNSSGPKFEASYIDMRYETQALFCVYRTNHGLEIDKSVYLKVAGLIGDKITSITGLPNRIYITKEKIEKIEALSHNPSLKAEYVDERNKNFFTSGSSDNNNYQNDNSYNTAVSAQFIVYETDHGLEIDRETYIKVGGLRGYQIPSNQIPSRVKVTEVQIEEIESKNISPRLKAKYVDERTKSQSNTNSNNQKYAVEMQFVVYDNNGIYEVDKAIYEKLFGNLKKATINSNGRVEVTKKQIDIVEASSKNPHYKAHYVKEVSEILKDSNNIDPTIDPTKRYKKSNQNNNVNNFGGTPVTFKVYKIVHGLLVSKNDYYNLVYNQLKSMYNDGLIPPRFEDENFVRVTPQEINYLEKYSNNPKLDPKIIRDYVVDSTNSFKR